MTQALANGGRRSRQLLQSAFDHLGPISRRDQRIKQLEEERRRLAEGPSYEVRLEEERRLRALESELGAPSRSVIAGGKFHVYDLVRSHGIDVPEQFGRWHDPADIPWNELPDAVVIKSAFGAATRGVLPLRRVDGGWQVATRDATVTSAQLTADLAALAAKREVRPPFGAEEFLDDGSGTVPVDIKVYTFYGEAPVARLRRVFEHRPGGAGAHRVVDRNGIDLVDTYRGKPTDPTIPLPGALANLFDVAERVSIVIRAPFSRIDLYDIRGRIVFGEVTPRRVGGGCSGPTSTSRWARRGSGHRSGSGATSPRVRRASPSGVLGVLRPGRHRRLMRVNPNFSSEMAVESTEGRCGGGAAAAAASRRPPGRSAGYCVTYPNRLSSPTVMPSCVNRRTDR